MQLHTLVKQPMTLLAVLSIALAACGDSTAPDAPFDPAGMSSDVTALESVFTGPVFNSYAMAAEALGDVAGGSATAVLSTAALGSQAGILQGAHRMAARLHGNTGLQPNFNLGAAEGKTFEYNTETEQYEPTGPAAPDNSVRFILYAINPVTLLPVEPLDPIGHVQLTVTENEVSTTAQLTVVSEGTTYFDYTAVLTFSQSSGVLAIDGFLTNGTDQVNFEQQYQVTPSQNGSIIVFSYSLGLPNRNFILEATTTLQVSAESQSATLQFEARGENGRVTMSGTLADGDGIITVRVNGSVFATVTFENDIGSITGADGEQLTQEELQTLEQVYESSDGGFFIFQELATPTGLF